ncbi:hypothetical protein [Pseudoxanthomonas indica]|nr:hypothetical protein [Pseudoxanthomonas indica]
MNPALQALSLPALALALIAPASASRACTISVVDVGLVTTVTVTAATDEDCRWDDNNPNNARLLSVVGAVVPNLLAGYSADFQAASTHKVGEKWQLRLARCSVFNIPGCAGEASLVAEDSYGPNYRDCWSENEQALSSTNVCVFERVVP